MAVYRKVSISFWTDPTVDEKFSPEDKYFFLYLLTNPHTNLCGCYEISYKQMKDETGYSRESIITLINRFESTYNIIRYDKTTYELLILNWKKYNWSNSPKFETSIQKEMKSIKNQQFREFLLGERYCIDTVSDQSDTVSIAPVTVTVTDTVIDRPLDYNPTKETKRVRKKYEDTEDFKRFWDAYPKQKGKTEAREAFAKVDVPIDVLLSAIETQKRSRDWIKEGGQYIPYPAKWLNKRRWEDSVDVNIGTHGMERYSNLQRLAEEFENE